MYLAPLASVAALEERLTRTLGNNERVRAAALLDDASAAVRTYTGQQITAGSTVKRLLVRDGYVRLPQRPVTAVTSVKNTAGAVLVFSWFAGDQVDVTSNLVLSATYPGSRGRLYVDVTYSHGYATVPRDLMAVVCQIAARALGRSADESGVQQESIAGYSYTVGSAAAAGAVGMLPDERRVLDRYRRVGGSAVLAS